MKHTDTLIEKKTKTRLFFDKWIKLSEAIKSWGMRSRQQVTQLHISIMTSINQSIRILYSSPRGNCLNVELFLKYLVFIQRGAKLLYFPVIEWTSYQFKLYLSVDFALVSLFLSTPLFLICFSICGSQQKAENQIFIND